MLPSLPVPAPGGYDASRLVGLVAGLYFFIVARPLDGVGYRWSLSRRDAATAVFVFVAYAAIALPIGFGTGFITWNPRAGSPVLLLQPLIVYLVTAVPEEFLFRGLIQNLLSRRFRCPAWPRDCLGDLRAVASAGSAVRGVGDDCRRCLRIRVRSHG
jgi:membrane protease YdiL (CAAX protease family)